MKQCYKCKKELEVTDFGKDKSKADGLNVYCKECIRYKNSLVKRDRTEYQREYKKNNLDKLRKYKNDWKKKKRIKLKNIKNSEKGV